MSKFVNKDQQLVCTPNIWSVLKWFPAPYVAGSCTKKAFVCVENLFLPSIHFSPNFHANESPLCGNYAQVDEWTSEKFLWNSADKSLMSIWQIRLLKLLLFLY